MGHTFAVTMPVKLLTLCPFNGDMNAGPWMSVMLTACTGSAKWTARAAAVHAHRFMAVVEGGNSWGHP